MELTASQWAYLLTAALFIALAKTCVPAIGIMVAPLMASAFGGRPSVGITLPMLIFTDIWAVAWYYKYTQWDKVVKLLPWVAVGFAAGAGAHYYIGEIESKVDIMSKVIGALVLVMLVLHILRNRLDERLTPKSTIGLAFTGAMAGFATIMSNAAGPVMAIYLLALGMNKHEWMGTAAWFFFIVNVSKMPILFYLSGLQSDNPIITLSSLSFTVYAVPVIVAGVFAGKWILPRIPQKIFNDVALGFAAIAAIKLLVF